MFYRAVERSRNQRWRNNRRRNLRCNRHRGWLRWVSTRCINDYRRHHRVPHGLEFCQINSMATSGRQRLRVRTPAGFALRWFLSRLDVDGRQHIHGSSSFVGVCLLFINGFSQFTHKLRRSYPMPRVYSLKFGWRTGIHKRKQRTCHHQACDSRILCGFRCFAC